MCAPKRSKNMSPKKQARNSANRETLMLAAGNGVSVPSAKRKEDAQQAIYLNRI